jgi:hypothetical protein
VLAGVKGVRSDSMLLPRNTPIATTTTTKTTNKLTSTFRDFDRLVRYSGSSGARPEIQLSRRFRNPPLFASCVIAAPD